MSPRIYENDALCRILDMVANEKETVALLLAFTDTLNDPKEECEFYEAKYELYSDILERIEEFGKIYRLPDESDKSYDVTLSL